jgi:dTDP-4-amino-4,6-dideoxygalactose transaminase
MIPLLDLGRQYRALKAEIDAAVLGVLESGHFIDGPNVKAFEAELARYTNGAHVVGLNSGTDALALALRALDVGPGDEVVTTPFTFIATAEAITLCGATPVFADVDPATLLIDPNAVAAAISNRTKVILPVHLYGLPADMYRIGKLAAKHGLAVVEDCAQALGALAGDRCAGTAGTIGAISFFPSKNLGAYGDGGAAITDDAALADRIRTLRTHGAHVKYHHEEPGVNSRLDEIQAAILRCKLPRLDAWIVKRQAVAAKYRTALHGVEGVVLPPDDPLHTYHQFTVRVQARDDVAAFLREEGIATAVYYPVPLHLQRAYEHLGVPEGSFPIAERAAREVLSLPIFPEMEDDEIAVVARALERAASATRSRLASCAS